MRYTFTLLLLAFFALNSCNTAKSSASAEQDLKRPDAVAQNDVNDIEVDATTGVDLSSYLRRIPGVQVRGSGPEATVRIRDQRSSSSDTSPLFVVNGTILGNSFASLYSSIDPNEIARIRVLKTASETNRYGLQGGNGVIEIKLKK